MIKIFPLFLSVCLLLAVTSCRIVPANEVLPETSGEQTSEPSVTDEPGTSSPETTSPDITSPETISPVTTAPITTLPETTPPGSVGIAYFPHYALGSCTVTGIGAFEGEVLEIPAEIDGLVVVSIGREAFAGMTGLTRVILPETLKTIEAEAFAGCKGLTALTLPASLEKIGVMAFSGCSRLTEVTFVSPDGWNADGEALEGLSDPTLAAVALRTKSQTEWMHAAPESDETEGETQ